jgi:16S rRNA U516 pseudouridylate synthase RsuA-like enzyme
VGSYIVVIISCLSRERQDYFMFHKPKDKLITVADRGCELIRQELTSQASTTGMSAASCSQAGVDSGAGATQQRDHGR